MIASVEGIYPLSAITNARPGAAFPPHPDQPGAKRSEFTLKWAAVTAAVTSEAGCSIGVDLSGGLLDRLARALTTAGRNADAPRRAGMITL